MRGTAENRAGAVFHQNEIGDIDRQGLAVDERVAHAQPGIEPDFFRLLDGGFRRAETAAFVDKGGQRLIALSQFAGQGMFGRDCAETGAEDRIRPGGVDFQPVRGDFRGLPVHLERDAQPFRPADPVRLHQADFFWPAVQRAERVEQFLGVIGDPEEPLRQPALFDRRARPPAAPVDHLFVGQNRLVDRVPVDPAFALVDQPGGDEIEKHFLFVAVIIGVAGGDFTGPVNRQAHHLELAPHGVDIGVGPFGGMDFLFHRRVFRRHAKRVPAHRVQHVEAARALVARDHVAHRVVADVAHVNPARRIGKHFQHVIFRPAGRFLGGETLTVFPGGLPPCLGVFECVAGGCI